MTKRFYEKKTIIDDIRSRPFEFTKAILFPTHYKSSPYRRALASRAWFATLLYIMGEPFNANMSYQDIARETGATTDTVRRHIDKGLRIAKNLANRGWVEPKRDTWEITSNRTH